jgi:hypothetical protein
MKTAIALFLCALLAGCVTTPADARRQAIERKLDDVVIPEISLRNIGMPCALYFLEDASVEYGKGGKGVSIVLIPSEAVHKPDTNDVFASESAGGFKLICLEAYDISLRDALNIVCELYGLTWKIEDSVIKVRMKKVNGPAQQPRQ